MQLLQPNYYNLFCILSAADDARNMVEENYVESQPEAKEQDISELDVEDQEKSLDDDLTQKNNVGWWGNRRKVSHNSRVSRVSSQRMHNQPISVNCGRG